MDFSGKYWSGLPFPPPEDLPDPGIEPGSPELAGRFFTLVPHGNPRLCDPPDSSSHFFFSNHNSAHLIIFFSNKVRKLNKVPKNF